MTETRNATDAAAEAMSDAEINDDDNSFDTSNPFDEEVLPEQAPPPAVKVDTEGITAERRYREEITAAEQALAAAEEENAGSFARDPSTAVLEARANLETLNTRAEFAAADDDSLVETFNEAYTAKRRLEEDPRLKRLLQHQADDRRFRQGVPSPMPLDLEEFASEFEATAAREASARLEVQSRLQEQANASAVEFATESRALRYFRQETDEIIKVAEEAVAQSEETGTELSRQQLFVDELKERRGKTVDQLVDDPVFQRALERSKAEPPQMAGNDNKVPVTIRGKVEYVDRPVATRLQDWNAPTQEENPFAEAEMAVRDAALAKDREALTKAMDELRRLQAGEQR